MTVAAFTLAPRVEPWHPAEPTEAELLAIDRNYAIAKDLGVLDRLRVLRALRQQVNEDLDPLL